MSAQSTGEACSWFDRLVSLPLRRPVTMVVVVVIATLLSLFAWPSVQFEPDVSRLLPAGHSHVRIANLLADRARPSRALWLLLRGAGPQLQTAVPDLAERLLASPDVAEVITTRSQLFAEQTEQANAAPLWSLEDSQLEALAKTLSRAGIATAVDNLLADLADDPVAGRELAVRDPLGLRWLLSAEGRLAELGFVAGTDLLLLGPRQQDQASPELRAIVQLRGTADAYDADFSTRICAHVEQVLASANLQVEMFGGYAVARADQIRIRADFQRASTWSVLLIALYLVWVMRGLRLPMLVQLPAMLSIAWAIPFGSVLFGSLPTVAVAAVAVLCGLGVDFAIHYAARYRRARLTMPHADAVAQVQRTTVPELLIDMATTAVTFLAIGAGSDSGLRAFGWLLALGLVFSVLLTAFVLPVLLRFAGDRQDPERSVLAALSDRWLRWPRSPTVAWTVIAATLVGVAYLANTGILLSAESESLRPKNDAIAAARGSIESQIGFSTVPVVALWPAAADASPLLNGLQQARDVGLSAGDSSADDSGVRFWSGLQRFDTQSGRDAVASCRGRIAGFVVRAKAELDQQGLDVEAFAPALAELERRFAADPTGKSATLIDYEGVPHRAVTVWPDRRLNALAFATFEQRLHKLCGSQVTLHGGPSMFAALEQMLSRDLLRACWVALLLAVVMVTIWLRSLRYGLLSLVPSAIGLIVTLVALRLLDIPLSMISFVAVPFVLGIGVDEGVHLVGHFRHAANERTAAVPDAKGSTGATGVGIVRTSIGTVLGFSALLLAESPGLQLLGAIVAFGSMACMLSCLFVLAPLLARFAGRARGANIQDNG